MSQLEQAGLVEKVASRPAALGLKDARWRVAPVVYRALEAGRAIVEHGSTPVSARITLKDVIALEFAGAALTGLSQRCERVLWRVWQGRQVERFGSLLPGIPWPFAVLTTLWLLPWSLFKLAAACLLWVVERMVGERGWLRRWLNWTIVFTAEDGLKARWAQAGLEPSEEFWLLYDAREGWGWLGLVVEMAVMAMFVWATIRFMLGRLEKDVWCMLGGLLLLVILASLVYAVAQLAWRVWIAYLYGVETWDIRMILAIARWLGMKEPERSA